MPRRGTLESRFERYIRSAQRTIPQLGQIEGVPVMPIDTHIRALARLHSSMQKRLDEALGRARDLTVQLSSTLHMQQRTQEYIKGMQGRIDQAASDGITVAAFVEQEHQRVREYRARGKGDGVYASVP